MAAAPSNEQGAHVRMDSPTAHYSKVNYDGNQREAADDIKTSSYSPSKPSLLRATKLSRKHYLYEQMLDSNFLNQQELKDLKTRYASRIWPNGTKFMLKIQDEHRNPSVASFIEHHNGWSNGANLDFSRTLNTLDRQSTMAHNRPVAEIRILVEKQNHASIGIDSVFVHPAYPTMVLEDFASLSTVLHEIGHVLGIQHEHQRWISNIEFDIQRARNYLLGFPDPIRNIVNKSRDTKIDPFEYDPNSIMHYCFHAIGEDAFLSAKPDQSDLLLYDQNRLTLKDRKLIAYLYPLPTGGNLKPRTAPYDADRSPRAQRQVVMLPHVWSSTCRVMLGLGSIAWQSTHGALNFHTQASAQCKRYFHLESWADNAEISLAYLALDPATANIQMISAKTLIETASIDPDSSHSTALHRLRWNTSSKAKVIMWIKILSVTNPSRDFELCVDHGMRLSYESKRLAIHTRSSEGVSADVDWLAINPDALNVDGGRVHWTSNDDSTTGFEDFKPWLFWEWGHKVPHVMTAVNGLKYRHTRKHHDHEDVFFKINVVHTTNSGFRWEIRTCHRECFLALSFSWVVVPKPVMEYFGFPKGDKRPKKYSPPTV